MQKTAVKSPSALQIMDDTNKMGLYYNKNAPEHDPCFPA